MTSVLLDDIIFELQRFGGASDFWRHLSVELQHHHDLTLEHRAGRSWQRFLPVATRRDVLHSSHFRVPLRRSTACVTTIYDLTYERGMIAGRSAAPNIWQRRRAVIRAQAIVTISESTRADLLNFYGDDLPSSVQVHTVPLGCTYSGPSGGLLPARLSTSQPYVLHVGNRAGYKNFERGARGFAQSELARNGAALWCTGADFDASEHRLLSSLGIAEQVRPLGVVSTDELGLLYEHAVALLYPSTYEGFGLPPLDAMSLGCPVVAANASSVPEVVGDAGVLVYPSSAEEFAAGLDFVTQEAERSELVSRGLERAQLFSWKRAAADYADVYRRVSA